MGYLTDGLKFNTLREANTQRVGHFKNSKGEPAHSKPDGSDWNPSMWLLATFGEMGELANVRYQYEAGEISFVEYKKLVASEIADVQIYLDIFAKRCLDATDNTSLGKADTSQEMMMAIAFMGCFANEYKKYIRGDIGELKLAVHRHSFLTRAIAVLQGILHSPLPKRHLTPVSIVNARGINLGNATMKKFNEVSERVGSPIWIDAEDCHIHTPPKD